MKRDQCFLSPSIKKTGLKGKSSPEKQPKGRRVQIMLCRSLCQTYLEKKEEGGGDWRRHTSVFAVIHGEEHQTRRRLKKNRKNKKSK